MKIFSYAKYVVIAFIIYFVVIALGKDGPGCDNLGNVESDDCVIPSN